jgi:5-methylthioadenosine/S-adenosylhomocysteine deaminase
VTSFLIKEKEKNMEYDYLISNGLLLTMGKGLPIIDDGAVLIKEGTIEACGQTTQFANVDVKTHIDANKKIIMPGLVNCHTHLPMSMFRGLADDLPLDVWLNEHIFPAEATKVNPESVEKWSRHSCIEMLLSGTTTCCDGYFYEANTVKALLASGIRAVAGQGVIDFPAPGVPDPKKNIQAAIEFVKIFKDVSPILSPSIFCHSPYTCSKQTLISAKKAANDLDVLFQIHVAETKNEVNMISELGDMSIIQYLDSIDILDEKTLLIHSIWIDDKDIEIIKKKHANVVHCPESNMKLGSGIAPVPRLIKKGVPVGLGTDGCASNNDHDLFSEMDTAAKLHKVALLDPTVMDARTTLRMATIQGACAIGLGQITGSLEKGKRADIILVDIEKPHTTPMYDPYSCLVYSAKSSDVSLVIVDGKILVQKGKIV